MADIKAAVVADPTLPIHYITFIFVKDLLCTVWLMNLISSDIFKTGSTFS